MGNGERRGGTFERDVRRRTKKIEISVKKKK
jgi:hypothetical protein